MISHSQMLARIFAECPPERRQELARLIERRPFWVADLAGEGIRAADSGRIGGVYVLETDQVFLDCNLPPDANALSIYLHETVHAGEWSNGVRLRLHDARFNRAFDEACARFGLVQTAVSRDYNTRDLPERASRRAPGVLAFAAFGGIGLALYAKTADWVGMTGFFVILGAACVAAFAEKIRQARA